MSDDKNQRLHALGQLPSANWKPLPELVANVSGRLIELPEFGVWHITAGEAAELIAMDMWGAGEFPDLDEPEDWDGVMTETHLRRILAGEIDKMYKRLCAAISSGTLKAKFQRDLDDNIQFDGAYIAFSDLDEWLNQRGYHADDEYSDHQERMSSQAWAMAEYAQYLRSASKDGRMLLNSIAFRSVLKNDGGISETATVDELKAAIKQAYLEIQEYKAQIDLAKASEQLESEKPLKTRERNSLLKIIRAILHGAKIQPNGRDTVSKIKNWAEAENLLLDEGTIKKYLRQIADD